MANHPKDKILKKLITSCIVTVCVGIVYAFIYSKIPRLQFLLAVVALFSCIPLSVLFMVLSLFLNKWLYFVVYIAINVFYFFVSNSATEHITMLVLSVSGFIIFMPPSKHNKS